MMAVVQLHAGWTINRLAPALFRDKPVVRAVLADDDQSSPGRTRLFINNRPYTPNDAAPECLASSDLIVMNDAVFKYDFTNPVASRLVADWFKQAR
ncbi:MAG TPA: hypothetical protein VEK08_16760 [Planctomycetota bacterium]|nr:hypothetical protein [Planctomycetota bacterium]